jgi:hypothetical protein
MIVGLAKAGLIYLTNFRFPRGKCHFSDFGVAVLHVLSTMNQTHSGKSDALDFRRIPKKSVFRMNKFQIGS